ncbi:MAG: transglutaminase family protein [Acidimicrobiales bacterium]
MDVRVGCRFSYLAEVPTAAILQVEPRLDGGSIAVREQWSTDPVLDLHPYRDAFGNLCRRTTLPAGATTLGYDGVVRVSGEPDESDASAEEIPPDQLPDEVLAFIMPSRFCLPDQLGDVAWTEFGGLAPGYARVQAVCDFVHDHLRFDYDASSPLATALDVYQAHAGVCRDFAHLGISLCRALNIPARYAFGYIPDLDLSTAAGTTMDFCAWMEVFLGGRWWTFDPRNNVPRAGRVLIGLGRDAVDVAMITTFGGPELTAMSVWADVEPSPSAAGRP